MSKLIFEKDSPSGKVLIHIPEFGTRTWLPYITDTTFHEEGVYEKKIQQIEEDNPDKIIVVVNDNSNHGFVKRCLIKTYDKDYFKPSSANTMYSRLMEIKQNKDE